MLIGQGKIITTTVAGAILRVMLERRHITMMNKAEIRELIALIPVYPGVDRLHGKFGERI